MDVNSHSMARTAFPQAKGLSIFGRAHWFRQEKRRELRGAMRIVSRAWAVHSGPVFGRLLILFIGLPLLELMLLIRLGQWVGLGPTIALVMVTGFLGAALARQQGFKVWTRIQRELQAGRVPAVDMVDALLILIGGLLLLTPGLLTDLCGFALMIPRVRLGLRTRLEKRFRAMSQRSGPGPGNQGDGPVIDV